MKVRIRVAAALREFLPQIEGAEAGRFELELPDQATPADVISRLNIPEDRRLMVIVDDNMVTRPELGQLELTEGQLISLNPPIQAG